MSILKDHFERKAALVAQGGHVVEGLYMDVVDTLSDGYYKPNLPLLAFARWNHTHKLLGKNHVFSSDVTGAAEHLRRASIDLYSIGIFSVKSKSRVYESLHRKNTQNPLSNKDCLEMVIDDLPPVKTGAYHAEDVLTWFDPHSPEVSEFLTRKQYLNFTA